MITANSPTPIRIATVDDHPLTRFALKTLVQSQPNWNVVAECESPGQFLSTISKVNPQVVVIDLLFSDESGIDLLEHLRSMHAGVSALVYSMREERHYAQRCFRAGAMGYVCKNEPLSTIITAIEHVLAGRRYVSERLAGVMMQGLKNGSRLDGLNQLSNRELEVFQYIGNGLDTRQIARSICRSPKTVETYRYRIKKKLGLDNSIELAQLACIHANGLDGRD